MGKWCLHASSFIFDRIIIKVAGNQDRHKARTSSISGLWFPWPIYMFFFFFLFFKWDLTLAHWTQVSDRCPLGYLFYGFVVFTACLFMFSLTLLLHLFKKSIRFNLVITPLGEGIACLCFSCIRFLVFHALQYAFFLFRLETGDGRGLWLWYSLFFSFNLIRLICYFAVSTFKCECISYTKCTSCEMLLFYFVIFLLRWILIRLQLIIKHI